MVPIAGRLGPVAYTRRRLAPFGQSLDLGLAGGRLNGSGNVSMEPPYDGRVQLTWLDIDAGSLQQVWTPATPVRIGSRLAGKADLRFEGASVAWVDGVIDVRSEGVHARDQLAATGSAALRLRDGRWMLVVNQGLGGAMQLDARANGRFTDDRILASSIEGELTLDAPDVSRLSSVQGLGIAWPEDVLRRVTGGVQAQVQLGGTLGAPTLSGELAARGLRDRELGAIEVSARISADPRSARLEQLEAASSDVEISATAETNLRTREVGGAFQMRVADVAGLPGARLVGGSLAADGSIGGRWPRPLVEARVSSEGARIAGQTFDRISGTIRFQNGELASDGVELSQPGGSLAIAGRFGLTTRQFQARITGSGLTLSPVPAGVVGAAAVPVSGRVDVDFEATGSLAEPSGAGRVSMKELVYDRRTIGDVYATVKLAEARVQVDGEAPQLATTFNGTLAVPAPHHFAASVTIADADLRQLPATGRSLPDALEGRVSATARAEGQVEQPETISASIDLRALDATMNGWPIRLSRPGQVSYSAQRIEARSIELMTGATAIQIEGRMGLDTPEALTARAQGELSDIVTAARAFMPQSGADRWTASGPFALVLEATGSPRVPALTGTVRMTNGSVAAGDTPAITNLELQSDYRNGVLDVTQLAASVEGARVTGSGRIPARIFPDVIPRAHLTTLSDPLDRATFAAAIDSITPATLARFVDPKRFHRSRAR